MADRCESSSQRREVSDGGHWRPDSTGVDSARERGSPCLAALGSAGCARRCRGCALERAAARTDAVLDGGRHRHRPRRRGPYPAGEPERAGAIRPKA
jgi:hypothetical protein